MRHKHTRQRHKWYDEEWVTYFTIFLVVIIGVVVLFIVNEPKEHLLREECFNLTLNNSACKNDFRVITPCAKDCELFNYTYFRAKNTYYTYSCTCTKPNGEPISIW